MSNRNLIEAGAAKADNGRALSFVKTPSIAAAFANPEEAPAVISNILADDADRPKLFMATLSEADFSADDLLGVEFELNRFICVGVKYAADDDGAARHGIRTILVDVNGKTAGFGSDGIVRALDMLIGLFGPGPWSPSLVVKVVQLKLAGGHRLLSLEYVGRGKQS